MFNTILTSVIVLLFISTLVFNILQVRIIYKVNNYRFTVENIPVVNLSVVCIVVGIVSVPLLFLSYVVDKQTLDITLFCVISYNFSSCAINLLLAGFLFIGLERYLAVLHPSYHRNKLSPVKLWTCCLLFWIFAVIIAVVQHIVGEYALKQPYCDTRLLFFTTTFSISLTSITGTIFCYVRILRVAHSRIAPNGITRNNTRQLRRAYTMFSVFILSVGIWIPIIILLYFLKDSPAQIPISLLGFSSLFFNFFIHLIKCTSFRSEITTMLCGCCTEKQPKIKIVSITNQIQK